jgi:hypothetical protein
MNQEDVMDIIQDVHDDSNDAFHTMLENFPIPISFFEDCDACSTISGEQTPKRRRIQEKAKPDEVQTKTEEVQAKEDEDDDDNSSSSSSSSDDDDNNNEGVNTQATKLDNVLPTEDSSSDEDDE